MRIILGILALIGFVSFLEWLGARVINNPWLSYPVHITLFLICCSVAIVLLPLIIVGMICTVFYEVKHAPKTNCTASR